MNTTVNKQLQRVNFAINQHRTRIVFYYRVCKVSHTATISSEYAPCADHISSDIIYKLTAPSRRLHLQTYAERQDKSLFKFKMLRLCI